MDQELGAKVQFDLEECFDRGLTFAAEFGHKRAGSLHVLLATLYSAEAERAWLADQSDLADDRAVMESLARGSATSWASLRELPQYSDAFRAEVEVLAESGRARMTLPEFVCAAVEGAFQLDPSTLAQVRKVFAPWANQLTARSRARSGGEIKQLAAFSAASLDSAQNLATVLGHATAHGAPCIGIEVVQEALNRSLHQSFRRGTLLVGKSGVGKSAQVAAFAARNPDCEVRRIACTRLAAQFGSQVDLIRGVNALISGLEGRESAILFFDDIHVLARGAGAGGVSPLLAFNEPLSGPKFRVWGATTAEGYESHFLSDPTLASRFTVVRVEEPDEEATLRIASCHADSLERRLLCEFDRTAWPELFSLAKRFLPSQAFPEKMLHVLDLAAQFANQEKGDTPARVGQRETQLAVSRLAKVPIDTLTEYEQERLKGLQEFLDDRVYQQRSATLSVARALRMLRLGLKSKKRTGGAFMFVGPPGTGKTELAKALAEFLGGSEDTLLRFNMSEFQTPESYQRLIGPPPGYVGYEAGGELTNALRENPYSIVLFDEIEKGSSRVFDLLLQVLSDGHLTDNKGRVVDCKNSVFVMTSNAISETLDKDESALRKELKDYRDPFAGGHPTFRPEFLDRLEIVPFDHLQPETLQLIARREIASMLTQANTGGILNCSVSVHQSAVDWILAEASAEAGGARAIQRVLESRLGHYIAQEFLDGRLRSGQHYRIHHSENDGLTAEEAKSLKELS